MLKKPCKGGCRKMLKGINKQIIEIRCSNNEIFDKILLFVRGDAADLPRDVLTERAEEMFGGARRRGVVEKPFKSRYVAVMAGLYTAGAVIIGVLIWFGLRL